MKIKPVKNYSRPKYAALAAITAMGTLTGCGVQTEGIAPAPTDIQLSGDVAIIEETSTTVPAGTVPIPMDSSTDELQTSGQVPVSSDEIGAEGDTMEFSSEGIAVVPKDTDELQIDGGISIEQDIEAREFSLAGDIAIVPDYEADSVGSEYEDAYIEIFDAYAIPVKPWTEPDDTWGTALSLGDIPFIVALEGDGNPFYISFYNPDNEALIAEIENAGGIAFENGYLVHSTYKDEACLLVFIDISKPHYEYVSLTASAVINEGITPLETEAVQLAGDVAVAYDGDEE